MIKHILADGTVLSDITGHTITMEDAPVIYEILNRINAKGDNNNECNSKQE